MSTIYLFFIDSNLGIENTLQLLGKGIAVPNQTITKYKEVFDLHVPKHLYLTGREIPEWEKEGIKEDYEVQTNMCISTQNLGDFLKKQMVQGAFHLLQETEGDAIFFFNMSIIMFIRKSGELTLNTQWDWDDEELSWIKQPFELKDLSEKREE